MYKKRHDIQEQKAFRIGEENSRRMAPSISIISQEQGEAHIIDSLTLVRKNKLKSSFSWLFSHYFLVSREDKFKIKLFIVMK